MMDIWSGALALASPFGGLLLIYALYRMTRHEVLLFGSVEARPHAAVTANPERGGDAVGARYRYMFFLQNLEEVSFPGPFECVIRDLRSTSTCNVPLAVDVLAGPRHICGGSGVVAVPGEHDAGMREWRGQFEQLSPFDTWKFVCETSSTWLEFEIETQDPDPKKFIRQRLIVDLTPRKIGLQADHAQRTNFKGARITPAMDILFAISAAVVLIYVGSINYLAGHERLDVANFSFNKYDLIVLVALVLALWIGYRRIQRRVYPIIQGYFLATPVQPTLSCAKYAAAAKERTTHDSP